MFEIIKHYPPKLFLRFLAFFDGRPTEYSMLKTQKKTISGNPTNHTNKFAHEFWPPRASPDSILANKLKSQLKQIRTIRLH